jgi:hypothetical protein
VDLTEFALGGNARTVAKSTSWGGDYQGRPAFARELADLYRTINPEPPADKSIRSAVRLLFRLSLSETQSG